ncbi:MAG: alkaline phosphatase family protein [Thermoplasmata archaeon]|nr:alkaline phosphatase family protein [Thermoplasmata archaeon]
MGSAGEWESKSAEARSLAAPVGPLGLPRPAYDGRSVANLLPTIVRALGREFSGGPPLAPPLTAELDPFRGRRAEGPVVVVQVDGFGWHPFLEWAHSGSSLHAADWAGRARPITTVFPTTTVSALTSISSGVPPGRHGLVGPLQYLPRLGIVADVLRMSRSDRPGAEELVGPGWSPSDVSGVPSVFRRGVHGAVLTRRQFDGTGFNRVLYDGAEFVGYSSASDMAHLLDELLRRPNPPSLILAYWDELDTVNHLRGLNRGLFEFEAQRLAHLVAHVAGRADSATGRNTQVFVTADHGQVAVDPARQIRVDLIPEISDEMARPLAGDRRAGYFTARWGRLEALHAALDRKLPSGSRVIAMSEAVSAGLYGPPPHHPELVERLGDLLALVPVPSGLLTPRLRVESRSPEFLGAHSGLEPEELVVPLISGRLAEFRRPEPSAGAPAQL